MKVVVAGKRGGVCFGEPNIGGRMAQFNASEVMIGRISHLVIGREKPRLVSNAMRIIEDDIYEKSWMRNLSEQL
jgi:hypothetical protein